MTWQLTEDILQLSLCSVGEVGFSIGDQWRPTEISTFWVFEFQVSRKKSFLQGSAGKSAISNMRGSSTSSPWVSRMYMLG